MVMAGSVGAKDAFYALALQSVLALPVLAC
jgi:hypothetical protein